MGLQDKFYMEYNRLIDNSIVLWMLIYLLLIIILMNACVIFTRMSYAILINYFCSISIKMQQS